MKGYLAVLVGWLAQWLPGWLDGGLAGWLAGWLAILVDWRGWQLVRLRDQHIQTCQFKITNVKIHPAVPTVYTHLISFGPMEMANASGNFGNALVGLRAWNDAIHDFRRNVRKNCIFSDRKKNNVFSGICKNAVFSGHGSRMTVRKNIGYLAGWLSGWLAGYL